MFNLHDSTLFSRFGAWPLAIGLAANGAMLLAFVNCSLRSSPPFDETAHFASGIILAQHADAGYFKVNPPVNKWITACSSLLSPDLSMPKVVSSSSFPNAARPEFIAGDSLLELNRDQSYFSALVISRLARVPFFLFASWMLWQLTNQWLTTKRLLCQVLWCTSPLILGHGWIVSADALCGVAMCFILWTTVVLWKNPTWLGFAISGLAWGLAIGTKFTFGPLVLLYPLGVHLCASKGWTSSMLTRPDAQHNDVPVSVLRRLLFVSRYWFLHAAVACLVINTLYLFHETAMPIEKHDFIGMTFRSLTKPAETDWAAVKHAKSFVAMIPSPFPRSFLVGVDQQMADMDRPRGAYILGSRVPGEIHWFYLVGYAMKEQLALLLATMIGLLCFLAPLLSSRLRWFFHGRAIVRKSLVVCEDSGTIEDNRSTLSANASGSIQQHDRSVRSFCAFFLLVFGLFMTTQANLVRNVRYLIPALPLIYLLVSFSVPSFEIRFATKGIIPTGDTAGKSRTFDLLFMTIISVALIEFLFNFPHHFSYINPLFGGSHRVPIALNDSNFDYGQDLFYARDWVERHQAKSSASKSSKVYGVLSGHGCYWLEGMVEPATVAILQKAIQAKKEVKGRNRVEPMEDVVIFSRGLFHPEPWAVGNSKLGDDPVDAEELLLVQELLSHPPDFWITPVVVVYRLFPRGDETLRD